MSKRGATTPLNQDNWDHETEPEDAGNFATASTEEMKNRVVKKAKRRSSPAENKSSESAFSSFTGFGAASSTASSASIGKASENSVTTCSFNLPVTTTTATTSTSSLLTINGNSPSTKAPTPSQDADERPQKNVGEFFHRLRTLNEAVVNWITMHVQKNPHCVLSPIFRDYEKYFAELERKYPNTVSFGQPTRTTDTPSTGSTASPVTKPNINPWIKSEKTAESAGAPSTILSSGYSSAFSTSARVIPDDPSMSSGGPSTNALIEVKPPGLQLPFKTPGPGLSFAVAPKDEVAVSVSSNSAEKDDQEQEEYIPPTVEVQPVNEEGSFHTVKCKLFYKLDNTFTEKGVGSLHLKSLGEKIQLIIRADNVLGNIIFNIVLNDSIPIQRTGKNNVLICCVPNPPINASNPSKEPIPVLIRVKTAEDADELFNKLKKTKS